MDHYFLSYSRLDAAEIRDAIQGCAALIFVMMPDSVRDHSHCKAEWVWALKHKKPVIPVGMHSNAELPFRLGSLQRIDFTDQFAIGLAQLAGTFGGAPPRTASWRNCGSGWATRSGSWVAQPAATGLGCSRT